MAVCTKCYTEGVIGGILHMPDPDAIFMHFELDPAAGTEFEGIRDVVIRADVTTGSVDDGWFLAKGELVGSFALENQEIRQEATIEAFARDGLVNFVHLTVDHPEGGALFSGNIRLDGKSEASDDGRLPIVGSAFVGRLDRSE